MAHLFIKNFREVYLRIFVHDECDNSGWDNPDCVWDHATSTHQLIFYAFCEGRKIPTLYKTLETLHSSKSSSAHPVTRSMCELRHMSASVPGQADKDM